MTRTSAVSSHGQQNMAGEKKVGRRKMNRCLNISLIINTYSIIYIMYIVYNEHVPLMHTVNDIIRLTIVNTRVITLYCFD